MAPRHETVVELVDEMSLLLRAARAIAQRTSARVDMPAPLLGLLWTLYVTVRCGEPARRSCASANPHSAGRSRSWPPTGSSNAPGAEDDGRVSLVQISEAGRERMNTALEHRVDEYAPSSPTGPRSRPGGARTIARLRQAIAEWQRAAGNARPGRAIEQVF